MSDTTTTQEPPVKVEATAPKTETAPQPKAEQQEPPSLLADIVGRMKAIRKESKLPDGDKKPTSTEPKTEVKPEPPKVDAKIDPEPKVEPKTEPKVKAEPPPRRRTHHTVTKPEVDTKQVVKEAVTEAIKAVQPAAKPEPKESPIPEMFRHDLDLYESLERVYPEKYGSNKLTKALADSAKRIEGYRTKWENENPGEQFNESDHQDEIDKLLPPISSREIARAQSDLSVNQRFDQEKKARQETERKMTKEEQQRTIGQSTKSAGDEFNRAIVLTVDPELEPLFKSGDQKKILERIDSNTAAHLVGDKIARKYEGDYARAAVLFSPEGASTFDQSSTVDKRIYNVLLPQMEQFLDGKEVNGRPYVPLEEFVKMPPHDQLKYTTVDRGLILDYIKALAFEEIQSLNLKMGIGQPKNGQPTERKTTPSVEQPPEKKSETSSPSSASGVGSPGGGPTIVTGAAPNNSQRSLRTKFMSGALGSSIPA